MCKCHMISLHDKDDVKFQEMDSKSMERKEKNVMGNLTVTPLPVIVTITVIVMMVLMVLMLLIMMMMTMRMTMMMSMMIMMIMMRISGFRCGSI